MSATLREPFATRVAARPDALYDVVFRVIARQPGLVGEQTVAAYYDALLADTQALRGALAPLAIFTGDERLAPGARATLAPYVRATLRGSNVAAAIAAIPQAVVCEVSGGARTTSSRADFDPRMLFARAIAEPLASKIGDAPDDDFDVIVELQTHTIGDPAAARANVIGSLTLLHQRAPDVVAFRESHDAGHPYIFATLTGEAIVALIELDRNPATAPAAIFRVWEDTVVLPLIAFSAITVKADATHVTYSAYGKNIVWAVLDSGIDASHPHFRHYKNLTTLPPQVHHRDFTVAQPDRDARGNDVSALIDPFGHGTHVAGIIGGALGIGPPFDQADALVPVAIGSVRDEAGTIAREERTFGDTQLTGMAPACTLLSYRVLDDHGLGKASSIIEAITEIRRINGAADNPVVHGVNLSVGYPFDAEWFACGQSPLCVEVNRLVKSGVVVVAAAGNSGYGVVSTSFTGTRAEGLGMSVNDPGNAELAITVGSVHRDEPHTFGVSYFSSKGPTGDGRPKPDLVAPGERIISCASAQSRTATTVTDANGDIKVISADDYLYREDSGTSMAAPHVSGVIAGFLSIRREYIGQPEVVKKLFMQNATDLNRDRNYQGAGLVDPMRVISSV